MRQKEQLPRLHTTILPPNWKLRTPSLLHLPRERLNKLLLIKRRRTKRLERTN